VFEHPSSHLHTMAEDIETLHLNPDRSPLEMESLGVCRHGGLLEGLGQCGMGMARAGNVLSGRTVFEGESSLSNHLTSIGSDDVNTQQTVGLGVGEHLDHALGVEVGLGTRVGAEWEGSNSVGDVLALEFLFALANPSNLRVGVHDGGDGCVVDMSVSLLDVLNDSNGLFLGLVGKHRTECYITHTADVRELGAVLGIDDDTATLIELKANVLETKALSVRSAADGDENGLCLELYGETS
jgi:hypothetical protein